jgi:hypothetical protein
MVTDSPSDSADLQCQHRHINLSLDTHTEIDSAFSTSFATYQKISDSQQEGTN